MNQLFLLVALTTSALVAANNKNSNYGEFAAIAARGKMSVSATAATSKKDTTTKKYVLQYDPSQLRIPGKTLPIGIVTLSAGAEPSQTKGFLNGHDGWSKFRLDVDSGSYSNGKIKIKGTHDYKKGDSITVNVYARKWLLGGKGKWLLTQKIPYDYEDSINILTTGHIGRAPGDHIQFGIRTFFDNKQFADKWFPVKKNLKAFDFESEGGHISKSKGDLKIDSDPIKIVDDKVRLIAMLAKDSAIRDTLQITLDYIANYQCKLQSKGDGHFLVASADVYFDSLIHANLMRVNVLDSNTHKTYRYLVNTNGGSITISSKGGSGMDGNAGWDGLSGSPGSSGTVSVDVETTTDADGNPTTTTTTVQGAGGDGGRGGDGGNGIDGGNGGNGGNIMINYTPAAAPFLTLIKTLSIPGAGGSGGRAGQGGTGGSGGDGNPSGNSGSNGMDGRAGFDGAAGSKGRISFVQSPS
jgi:hypothetical protein